MKLVWYKIAESIDELPFAANDLAEIEIHGKRLCIARNEGQLFACAAKCPHASGILADGFIDGLGNIVCPLHRYRYNLKNGHNVSGEGFHLRTYSIEKREDGLYVGLPKTNIFGI